MGRNRSGTNYNFPGNDEKQGWHRGHGVTTDHHKGSAGHLQPKKGDSAPKHDPAPVKHHKPDNPEYAQGKR